MPEQGFKNKVIFAIALVIGFIRRRDTRRQAMFFFTLAALATLFSGATFLERFLASRPLLFLCYWGVCAWLTLCALLLAAYDLLAIRAAASRETRRLRAELRLAAGLTEKDDPGAFEKPSRRKDAP